MLNEYVHRFEPIQISADSRPARRSLSDNAVHLLSGALLLLVALLALAGCGDGGYAGGSIEALSATSLTLDAGQSFPITAMLNGTPTVTWTLTGCSGSACGAVSPVNGKSTVYTAPPGLTAPIQLTLLASVAGTKSQATVAITVNPDPTITGTPPAGTVGVPYSTTITAAGGTAPLVLSVAGGSLPPGLTFNAATGVISGTPTAVGTSTLNLQATDASAVPYTVTAAEAITIRAPLTVVSGNPPDGTVGTPYTTTLQATGGVTPYTWSVIAGTLPAGLTLSATTGVISGTPTVAGLSTFTAQAQDAAGTKASAVFSITVHPPALSLTTGTLPNGTVAVPYSSTIGVTGGTAPYSCVITAGTLPAGLTLGANCLVSGTPTVAGTQNLTVKATDSSNPQETTTGPVSITITPAALTITTGTLPNGTVAVPYSSTIGVAGGTAPYSCLITAGTLPAGLALGANCLVSGTPTVAGTQNLTVKATDASNPQETATGPVSITINPAGSLILSDPPPATAGSPYNGTIGVSGGTAPYSCTIDAGTLPSGLTLGANCVVTGTPTTPGTSTITVTGTDSGNPGKVVTGPVKLVVNPKPLTLTTGTLPDGTVAVPYSSTIGVTGGTAPYSCVITAGTLPAGLTLGANCLVSGTPTVAGTQNLTVKATDSSNPVETTSGPVSITINPAGLSITTGNLPNGTVSVPYSSTIGVAGGTAPYSCTITSGTLPAGLTLGAHCLVSGTPTVAGTANLTVHATDSSNPQESTTGPVSVTISPAGATLTLGNPPAATVNVPYSGTIPVAGGTGPYACALTAGTLPAGLSLGANCAVTGTPTTAGSTTVTVKATDSSSPSNSTTGPVVVTVNPASPTLTLGNPPAATVDTPYTGTIPVAGGTAPYSCTINSGTLPAGLTLGANCTITGTPTTAGSTTVTVTATDSNSPKGTVTGPVVVTVNPIPPLTFTGSLPNGIVGVPYSQTLAASGGVGPYTYTLTAGTLPPGITLSSTGVVSGTPTTPGASNFTVTATDSETTPQTAALPLVLLITYPTTATDAELKGPYAFLFQGYDDVVAGVLAYKTAKIGSFTADGTGVITAGELDSNHQASNPDGNTVPTLNVLGTYTIGADNRGSLTLSAFNSDGTVLGTTTYAIAVKAPVSPATSTARGSMIESDDNQLVGTKGSGMFLAQDPTAIAAGLNGSYAFGLGGDTPCLPACTVGIQAGPAASVGQFTAAGGAITAGTSDYNIATATVAATGLSGTYAASDANGRVQLTLNTEGSLTGVYPTDYAVYVVNANNAFIMSTDKHSAYILLAGSAELQTQATFNNASMTGPFVGYENSLPNPGAVGVTVQNVLNFSTATVFQAVGNGAESCTVNAVDVGGLTSLVGNLTGVLGSATGLNTILGAYSQTGTTSCYVTDPNGRGVLQYAEPSLLGTPLYEAPAPRVFYLSSPTTGYFLETGYAAVGNLQAQTGQPYTEANTFTGTYVYGTTPASSLASTDGVGVIQSHGNGTATVTEDENVGVGTINVIDIGVGMDGNYTQPNATTGRFTFNGTLVFYPLTPDSFVLLDTNPTTTSPSVALLY